MKHCFKIDFLTIFYYFSLHPMSNILVVVCIIKLIKKCFRVGMTNKDPVFGRSIQHY